MKEQRRRRVVTHSNHRCVAPCSVSLRKAFAVAADIHGFDGSWALGAMVYEIAQGSGQYGLVGAGGIVVAGALLVGLVVSALRRTGWARRLSTYVRLY